MRYTIGFKKSLVRRLLLPDSPGIQSLSEETGISGATLYNWLRIFREQVTIADHNRTPDDWSLPERSEALLEASALSNEDQGAWLRYKDLKSEHLTLWRTEIQEALKDMGRPRISEDLKEARRRIKELEKELRRKEKALAESVRDARTQNLAIDKLAEAVQVSKHTLQRYQSGVSEDRRRGSVRRVHNRLSDAERRQVKEIACEPRFRDRTPAEIVAILAAENTYIGKFMTGNRANSLLQCCARCVVRLFCQMQRYIRITADR